MLKKILKSVIVSSVLCGSVSVAEDYSFDNKRLGWWADTQYCRAEKKDTKICEFVKYYLDMIKANESLKKVADDDKNFKTYKGRFMRNGFYMCKTIKNLSDESREFLENHDEFKYNGNKIYAEGDYDELCEIIKDGIPRDIERGILPKDFPKNY